MKIQFLCILLLGTGFLVRGQSLQPEVIANSGDHFISPNSQLSWTLGEVEIQSWSAPLSNLQVTQGFHQTHLVITSIEKPLQNPLIEVFPVPFQDRLNVRLGAALSQVHVRLFDVKGSETGLAQLLNGGATHLLDVTDLTAGIYFLEVTSLDGQLLQSFKIQKIR